MAVGSALRWGGVAERSSSAPQCPHGSSPTPFRWRSDHIAAKLPPRGVLLSTRRGGVSHGPFASLNTGGSRTTATPTSTPTASASPPPSGRRRRFLYGRQVHEATVRRATEPPGPARPAAEEDRQATTLDDVAALVFTADCLPSCSSPTGRSRRCTAAGAGSRADRGGGRRGAARAGADGSISARRPLGARLLLRGRRRCMLASPRTARGGASAISTSRRSPARRSGRRRRAGPRRRAVHDLRRSRPVLLPPPRPRRDRAPGGVVWRA